MQIPKFLVLPIRFKNEQNSFALPVPIRPPALNVRGAALSMQQFVPKSTACISSFNGQHLGNQTLYRFSGDSQPIDCTDFGRKRCHKDQRKACQDQLR